MRTPIVLSAPWFDEHEGRRVGEALAGRVAGDGRSAGGWRGASPKLLGGARVLLTTSCTHALELALLALGIGPGQEVICPSFTFVSTANAMLRVGRPSRVRGHRGAARSASTRRTSSARLTPRTAAILPVHYAGVAPDMDALLDIARRRGLTRGRGRRPGPGRRATAAGRWARSATPAASASTRPRT